MTQYTLAARDFAFNTPLSFKAIDNNWIRTRSAELAAVDGTEPDDAKALLEAVEVLVGRLGGNAIEDADVMVYAPATDTDPYVVGIPIHRITPRAGRTPKEVNEKLSPVPYCETTKKETLRADFEDMLFEVGEHEISIIDRDSNGNYLLPWVAERWAGFQMYHKHFISIPVDNHKGKHNKTLAQYVVGKVNANGTVMFHNTPFRHSTRASATEEANRLSQQYQTAFAIFRCQDIIESY